MNTSFKRRRRRKESDGWSANNAAAEITDADLFISNDGHGICVIRLWQKKKKMPGASSLSAETSHLQTTSFSSLSGVIDVKVYSLKCSSVA